MMRLLQRWWWLALLIPLIGGLGRVRFDTDILNLLPRSVPAVRGLQLYQKHFTNGRELVITVRGADAEAAETAASRLAEALRRETHLVASATWQPPWLEHPEELAEFIAYLRLNEPPHRFAEWVNRLTPEKLPAVASEAREQLATSMSPPDIARLSYDPFGFTRMAATSPSDAFFTSPLEGFASSDGNFRIVYVEARDELADYKACAAWIAAVRLVEQRASREPEWPPGAIVRHTGAPAFVAEIATSMAADMKFSLVTTLALIVGLFWWAHRSWRPLFWLLVMLLLVMCGALAAGGWIFGTLNAVSLGFGAILLGLAIDYGLVVYQEAAAHPHLSPGEVRRMVAPGLAWSALTTSSAFLLLNFAGLPGLSQLGTIVGIGMILSPLVMLFLFLPLVVRGLKPRATSASGPHPSRHPSDSHIRDRVASLVIAGLALIVVWHAGIRVDRGTRSLEPKNCAAQTALNELRDELNQNGEPLLLVISGRDENEVAGRLDAVEQRLNRALTQGLHFSMRLPSPVWPHADWQRSNRAAAAELALRSDALRAAANTAGFSSESLGLTESVLRIWGQSQYGLWPTNQSCQWLLKRFAARSGTNWLAVGAVYPQADSPPSLAAQLDPHLPGVWLTGWILLGDSLATHVEQWFPWLVVVIVLVVVICLRAAFRRWTEVLISLGALGFALLTLQAVLSLAGLAWNLMSLAAVPLLLGAGVDYTIHVQLALRRHHGDLAAMRRVTGRAVVLCALTTVMGFGSNVTSSNPGLASLSLVCAIGLMLACLTAVILVPAWWLRFAQPSPAAQGNTARLTRPSSTYGPSVWRLGLWAVRIFPRSWCKVAGLLLALAYRIFRRRRFEILEENLLPVLEGDRPAARRMARALLANFAVKITDLMRHESGASGEIAVSGWSGYDILKQALDRKQGVLLVTPHLGNWEFGGCLLAQKGIQLLVLTQPEPGQGFTEMRQRARARWGIETLVVGQDAFAFLEIIKRLQSGATVALLIDRPPAPSAVEVTLFGRPFRASIAPAELARASGCAIVPVYVVAEGGGYSAHVLPEVAYDRRVLGSREARKLLAGEILRAFEPKIREHPDQWFHFVPLWLPDQPKLR